MDLSLNIGLLGWALAIVAALAFGVVAQFIGEARSNFEWLIDGAAAFVGAIVASEFITAWRGFEPVWEGLAIVPAVVGGLVLGVIVGLGTRFITGGRYTSTAA